jgi:hypothetical protein
MESVDRIIATRGDSLLRHEINLPSMILRSMGAAAAREEALPPGAGSITWLVVERDNSQLNTALNVPGQTSDVRACVDAGWTAAADVMCRLATAPRRPMLRRRPHQADNLLVRLGRRYGVTSAPATGGNRGVTTSSVIGPDASIAKLA